MEVKVAVYSSIIALNNRLILYWFILVLFIIWYVITYEILKRRDKTPILDEKTKKRIERLTKILDRSLKNLRLILILYLLVMFILLAGNLFFYYKSYIAIDEFLKRALSLFSILLTTVIAREEFKLLRRNVEKL